MPTSNDMHQKPVIFLAFANDKVRSKGYLQQLAREKRQLQNILEQEEVARLCEVVIRSDCTIDEIIDVFQNKRYRGRIVLFHYSGHACPFHLLLETEDGKHAPFFKAGSIDYFARQKSLRLIFLNACSTALQAEALIEAGIPAVIGTSRRIDDKVAADLSIRFYNALAKGMPLLRAWRETEDNFKSRVGDHNIHTLFRDALPQDIDRFPWEIYFKEGAEKVKEWSLPEAANAPLFGIPPAPPSGSLPEAPFRFLAPYRKEDSPIFFGRSHEIRNLYNHIADESAAPILLLNGQTGVGKSSLLEAGLLPRLSHDFTPQYERRDKEKGLLQTLMDNLKALCTALSPSLEKVPLPVLSLPVLWKTIESQTQKPLVFFLDQVDEVYTAATEGPSNGRSNEWPDFMEAVSPLFDSPAAYPRGKLILSFRSEYYSHIDSLFKEHRLNRVGIFIPPLGRQNIIDVVIGLTRNPNLVKKYNLKIKDSQLPQIIADDLLADPDSPIAPTLQIIMTRLWETAAHDRLPPLREFTVSQYRALQKQGLLLEDFFNRQMAQLGKSNPGVLQSGLALALLKFHTTPLGTSCSRDDEEIHAAYRQHGKRILQLAQQLKELYLLADTPNKNHHTRLAHDTLAPIVIHQYNRSDKPGQRAARILNAKLENVGSDTEKIYLDKTDLFTVEQGQSGMRAQNEKEQKLVENSWKHLRRLQRKARFRKIEKGALALIFLFLALFFQWQQQVNRLSTATSYAVQARMLETKDPTAALALAKKGWQLHKNQVTSAAIRDIYREHQFYKKVIESPFTIGSEFFSLDGQFILTTFRDGSARISDWQGVPVTHLNGHQNRIQGAAFAPDNSTVLTGSSDRTARLWDHEGRLIQLFQHQSPVLSVAFSPNRRHILTGTQDQKIFVWDWQGRLLNTFHRFSGPINKIAVSPHSGTVFVISAEGDFYVKKSPSKEFKILFRHPHRIHSLAVSPQGDMIFLASDNGTAVLRNSQGELLHRFKGHRDSVTAAAFSPCGLYVLTGSADGSAIMWDTEGTPLFPFYGHTGAVTSVGFTREGKAIFTGSADDTIRLWQLKDKSTSVLGPMVSPVTAVTRVITKQEEGILTGHQDGEIRISNPEGNPVNSTAFLHMAKHYKCSHYPITTVSLSPTRQDILIGDQRGKIALWSIHGQKHWEQKDHPGPIIATAFLPGGQFIGTVAKGRKIRRWSQSGEPLNSFEAHDQPITAAAYTRDGRYLLTGSAGGAVKLWDSKGNLLRELEGHTREICSISVGPDRYAITGNKKKIIITGSKDNTLRLWAWDGRPVATIRTPGYFIQKATVSADRNYIVTASNDSVLRLWDKEGNQLQIFKGHSRPIVYAAFSRDDRFILSGSKDGTLRQWRITFFQEFLKNGFYQPFSDEELKQIENKEEQKNENKQDNK